MNVTSMQLTQLWIKEETEQTYFPYIHYIIVFMSNNYEFVYDCICQAIVNNDRFDAVNWGVTLAQISSTACQKREKKIRIHSNKSRNHD